jgi:hypothetical protein
MCPITGSIAERRRSSRLTARGHDAAHPRRVFISGQKRGVFRESRGSAGELLGVFDDRPQRVTILRIVRQRSGVQHELAAGARALVVTIETLDAELVGGGLALADAFGLCGMEGIQLVAALALLLRADLTGACQGDRKGRFRLGVAADLAADIANDPAEPGAQQPQLLAMAVELLGVGVAYRPHQVCSKSRRFVVIRC